MLASVLQSVGFARRLSTLSDQAGFFHPDTRRHIDLMAFMRERHAERQSRVLDVGCGNGSFAERFHQDGGSPLIGTDWTPPEQVLSLASGSMREYVFADFNTDGLSSFSDASFDCLVCSDVLERVESPAALLREMARVLTPQGDLFLTIPNAFNLFERLRLLLGANSARYPVEAFDEYGPTHIFTSNILQTYFNRAGLQIAATGRGCCIAAGLMILPHRKFGPLLSYTHLFHLKRS